MIESDGEGGINMEMTLTTAERLVKLHGLDRAFTETMAHNEGHAALETQLLLHDRRTDSDIQDLLDDLSDFEIRQN
jgi:hypothetical protein